MNRKDVVIYKQEGFSGEDLNDWLNSMKIPFEDVGSGMIKLGELPANFSWENGHPHRVILWRKRRNRYEMVGMYFPQDMQITIFEFHPSPIETGGD